MTSEPDLRRLRVLLLAFMAAQVMYCIVALVIRETGFQPAFQDAPERATLATVVYVAGLLAVAGSFFLTAFAGVDSQKQFVIGFVVADTGAVLGLLLFFCYGDIAPLLVLAVLAAGATFAHYWRLSRQTEPTSRRE